MLVTAKENEHKEEQAAMLARTQAVRSLWAGLETALTARAPVAPAASEALCRRGFASSAPAPKKAEDAYVRPPSDKEVPRDIVGILDASAQTLFITELARGMSLALKYFFTKKVTVRSPVTFSVRSSLADPLSLSPCRS